MNPDLYSLYRQMFRSRLFEMAVKQLWDDGSISGEMHLGIGEEAICAGIVTQLKNGDAMALDHRGTPPLLMRGVDPILLLRELLGRTDGLCGGMGGHMHLYSREYLTASSGIVGASGPAAAGFALAAQQLRPAAIAIAFFGEGAMNQGMMLESMNLAVAWKLPVLFVCKDNEWAITTRSASTTGGDLLERARSFGMPAMECDGSDVMAVWRTAQEAIEHARNGNGPTFLHAYCTHPEGHFLGDPVLRLTRRPTSREATKMGWSQLKALVNPKGAAFGDRLTGFRTIAAMIAGAKEQTSAERDPLARSRQQLADDRRVQELEDEVAQEIEQVVETAVGPV